MGREEQYSDAKQGVKGPSWEEVFGYWSDLQAEYGHALLVAFGVTQDPSGRRGVRGVIGCECSPAPYASFTFGRAFAEAPSSLPAALYGALLRADDVLAHESYLKLEEEHRRKYLEESDDLPF